MVYNKFIFDYYNIECLNIGISKSKLIINMIKMIFL